MKKRLWILLFILIATITLTACGKKEEPKDELSEDKVILKNIKYKLNQDDEEYGIKYKIASNFRKSVMINAINYFSEKINGSSYFVVRIYHYSNKDLEYAIKDSVESYDKREEVRVGDVNYTKVHFVNYNGAETNLYYYVHNKDVYTFVFTAGIDLSRLEEIFLQSIVYE